MKQIYDQCKPGITEIIVGGGEKSAGVFDVYAYDLCLDALGPSKSVTQGGLAAKSTTYWYNV